MKENKARVTISLGNDLLERLDAYCERTGLTRSGYIGFVVAQYLDNTNSVMQTMNATLSELGAKALQDAKVLQDAKALQDSDS